MRLWTSITTSSGLKSNIFKTVQSLEKKLPAIPSNPGAQKVIILQAKSTMKEQEKAIRVTMKKPESNKVHRGEFKKNGQNKKKMDWKNVHSRAFHSHRLRCSKAGMTLAEIKANFKEHLKDVKEKFHAGTLDI